MSRKFSKDLESNIETLPISTSRKTNAILRPAFCALMLVVLFSMSFIGTKLVYDRYAALCSMHHFDKSKLGSVGLFGRSEPLPGGEVERTNYPKTQ